MDLTSIDDLKVALQLAGLKASKGLGQHFLVDQDSLAAVMNAGELQPDDTVLEIGPGLGVMTMPLTRAVKKVVAVEMDRSLAGLLERDRPGNLQVIQDDIMRYDLRKLPAGYKVVANIPYYITSAIFRLFLEIDNKPSLMAVLIQKEVAERIAAKPGGMSVLAFSVQYYATATVTTIVERHKFWPPPKVDSAVLQAVVRPQPAFPADRTKLFRLIRAGFGERRKQLKNSLVGGLNLDMELAARMIAESQLSPTVRAQEMSLDDWQRLYLRMTHYEIL